MRATRAKPVSPLARNAFSQNQSGKLGMVTFVDGNVDWAYNDRSEVVSAQLVRDKQTDLLTPNGVRDSEEVSGVSREQIRLLNYLALRSF